MGTPERANPLDFFRAGGLEEDVARRKAATAGVKKVFCLHPSESGRPQINRFTIERGEARFVANDDRLRPPLDAMPQEIFASVKGSCAGHLYSVNDSLEAGPLVLALRQEPDGIPNLFLAPGCRRLNKPFLA